MKILVTGAAGFIGMHVCQKLLQRGDEVIGIDNLTNYYDVNLKNARIQILSGWSGFKFLKLDITNSNDINDVFKNFQPQRFIHLAAQAGVRYSIDNPQIYLDVYLHGFLNIIEACRHWPVEHLVFASSSSVYGSNVTLPFQEDQKTDQPVSLYAATKKANELMAHTYSHLFSMPTTGLRFFTAFGPWGRPDMALFLFTKAILEGRPINIFNHGRMKRDFTFIDDIVECVLRVLDKPPSKGVTSDEKIPLYNHAPYKIFNVGNSQSEYIEELERSLNLVAEKNYLPLQSGDVCNTAADVSSLDDWINFRPNTSIKYGISKFVEWYRDYYKV